MTGNTNHVSIITLNVNGLNSPTKRHRLADWIKKKKKDPTVRCIQETHLIEKDIHTLKEKVWGKSYNSHELQKQARASILISNKVDFCRSLAGHKIMSHSSRNKLYF